MRRIPALRRVFRWSRAADRHTAVDVDDEFEFHLTSRIDELRASGVSDARASAIAASEFGDWNRHRAETLAVDRRFARDRRLREFLGSTWADILYASRTLRAAPAFTGAALLTLALGIGATTAVFSAVDGALLRSLPYATADRIVFLGEADLDNQGSVASGFQSLTSSSDNFGDWMRLSHSFAAMGIVSTAAPTLTGHGDPVRVRIANVSPGIFDVFHVTPFLGRRIMPADTVQAAPTVILLAYDFWQSRFGGDSAILGHTLLLNFVPATVVGILPPHLLTTGRLDRPLWANFVADTTDGRAGRSNDVYALLRPGVTVQQAQSEMTRIAAGLATIYPDDHDETVLVESLIDRISGAVRPALWMLLAASLLLLALACANLSNLLLARGAARARELLLRAGLGARRTRIVRQLVTDAAVLVVGGSVLGVLVARAAMPALIRLGPPVFAIRPPTINATVLLAVLGLTAVTTLGVGLLPAFRTAPTDPHVTLRGSGRSVVTGRGKIRRTLSMLQLALSVLLLTACGLVLKSFARVIETDPGVRTERLLTMQITLPAPRYDSTRSSTFYSELAERLRGAPGVEQVAFTSLVPLSGDFDRIDIRQVAGRPPFVGGDAPDADRYVVSPSYFSTMGIRLLQGRFIGETDRFDAPFVCLVDSVFARRVLGDVDPIGQRVEVPKYPQAEFATIVGVVSHVKTYGLDVASPGQIYISDVQFPWRWSALIVHTSGDPLAFAPLAARAVRDLDPNQPVDDVATMDELLAHTLQTRRFTLALLGIFAGVAVTLAAIGLYGVIAYGVTLRQREFAVRNALGARREQLAGIVLGEAARMTLLGVLLGTVGALAAGRLIAAILFEVSPHDPAVLAAVVGGSIVVALLATIVPTRRALRLDTAELLRAE